MLKICTVFFEGLYHPNAVSNLYRSLKENSSVPFEFICLADRGVDADVVLPYNKHSNIKLHWHKLKFFSPQFAYQKPGDDIIIMDIDQKIVGNVDDLLGHPVSENELVTYGQWWENKLGINGGFYKFKSGSLKFVWDDFALNPEYWQLHFYDNGTVHYKYYGEQNYVKLKDQLIPKYEGWPDIQAALRMPEEPDNDFQDTLNYMLQQDKAYEGTKWESHLFDTFPELKEYYEGSYPKNS